MVSLLTLEQAKISFITALEAELEAARKEDIAFDFTPYQKLSEGRNPVYIGTLEEEVNLLEGSFAKIDDGKGGSARVEIIAIEDFELVLATDLELEIGRTYTIRYNLAWILEALLDWVRRIDISVPRPIACGVTLSSDYFSPPQIRYEPKISTRLNEYQREAVIHALNSQLTFVWGPPGTGKSRTISELIIQYLIAGKSVLFLSQSNLAVDIVAKQVVQSGEKAIQRLRDRYLLLRSGYPKMPPLEQWEEVLPYEIALRQTPSLRQKLDRLNAERKKLVQQSKQGKNVTRQLRDNLVNLEQVRASVRDKVAELESRASFIATTLAKVSVTDAIRERRVDAVVVDEASMMNVPATFAALTLATQHGVVAGDFFQLQPIQVGNSMLTRRWLGQSVFTSSGIRDAFINGRRDDPRLVILKRQYRMADEISKTANAMFYGGILEDAKETERSLLPVPRLWKQSRLVFVDVHGLGGRCEKDDHSSSRLNRCAADVSSEIARRCMEQGMSVGVITPYRAQAKEIRSRFTREEIGDKVQVSTVHKFQGSEKDVIIFDVTDSRPMKPSKLISGSKETFLDPDKASPTLPLINVALTRAKSQIVVVADLDYVLTYLASTNILRTATRHFVEKGMVVDYATGKVKKKQPKPKNKENQSSAETSRRVDESAATFDQAKAKQYLKCTCGGNLAVRQNRYGGYFLGCSRYPRCKHTQALDDEVLLSIVAIIQPKCPKCGQLTIGMVKKGWPFLYCVRCGYQLDKQQVQTVMLEYS